MPNPILISYGNQYQQPMPVYYIEDDGDTADTTKVPANAPVPSLSMVNATDDFHFLMKQLSGDWNRI